EPCSLALRFAIHPSANHTPSPQGLAALRCITRPCPQINNEKKTEKFMQTRKDARKSLLHHIPSEQSVSVPKNLQTLTYPIPLSPSKMPQLNLPSDPESAEYLPVRPAKPSDEGGGGQNTAHAHAQTATDRRIDPLEPSILNPQGSTRGENPYQSFNQQPS
ncbi:hypothetical protein CMEL01_08061, partial [Colletotrichum melonis]